MKGEKIQFRGTSLLCYSQGKVFSTIPFCVGRVHLTCKKPVGNIQPIKNLGSGIGPRFCFTVVEYVGFICANLLGMGARE
jgi:hypothetical protein